MRCILQFLGKQIAGVNNSRNVSDLDGTTLVAFTHVILTEIEVFGAFVCARGGPIDGCFVVVVNCDALRCIGHIEIPCSVDNAVEFSGAFVYCHNFSNARAESCLILPDRFPSNWPPCPTDKETGHAAEFE
jgi:hypothetical protein